MNFDNAEPNIEEVLKEFFNLPRFEDGRINYSNSNKAPVLICFIMYEGKLLFLKRSEKVYAYKGLWSTVAGFIDSNQSLSEKVLEELRDELGIFKNKVKSIFFGDNYTFEDKSNGKTWIRYPILVNLTEKPEIKLDWEHTEYKWISPNEVKNYSTPPGTSENLSKLISK